jgi:hypothetical protein
MKLPEKEVANHYLKVKRLSYRWHKKRKLD